MDSKALNLAFLEEVRGLVGVNFSKPQDKLNEVQMEAVRFLEPYDKGELWNLKVIEFCVRRAEQKVRVRSMFQSYSGVIECWEALSKNRIRHEDAVPGCLSLWQHYENGQRTKQGHVAIVTRIDGVNYAMTLEGISPWGGHVEKASKGIFDKKRRIAANDGGNIRFKGFLNLWVTL